MRDAIKTLYGLYGQKPLMGTWTHAWNTPVYVFSNENVAGYLAKNPRMNGARVLSVCASGDHAFESLLAGASSVDTFDVNFMQKHVLELKAKMIQYLPYDQFMAFFFDPQWFHDTRLLRPLWKHLSLGARIFVRYAPVPMWKEHRQFTSVMLSYVRDPGAYDTLKERIPDRFNFIQTDIGQLSARVSGTYDVILLSNIIDYYNDNIGPSDMVMRYYQNVLRPLATRALGANGGDIYFGYIWSDLGERSWINRAIQSVLIQPNAQYRASLADTDTVEMQNLPTCEKFGTYDDIVSVMHHRSR